VPSDIEVRHLGGREVEVVVPSAATRHVVTVDDATLNAVGWASLSGDEAVRLVGVSFEYLLEREPATSILRAFRLSVIETYFPGYFGDIRARIDHR